MAQVDGQMRVDAGISGAGLMRSALSSAAGVMEWNDEDAAPEGLMRVIATVSAANGLMKVKNNVA